MDAEALVGESAFNGRTPFALVSIGSPFVVVVVVVDIGCSQLHLINCGQHWCSHSRTRHVGFY